MIKFTRADGKKLAYDETDPTQVQLIEWATNGRVASEEVEAVEYRPEIPYQAEILADPENGVEYQAEIPYQAEVLAVEYQPAYTALDPMTPCVEQLDENGKSYDKYLDTPDENGVYQPDLSALLDQTKADKTKELTNTCAAAIVGGFTSNALNSEKYLAYDSREVDQTNLIAAWAAAEVSGGTELIVCNDPSGQLGMTERAHTVAQVKQVLADFHTYRLQKSQQLTNKLTAVSSATLETIGDITWS